MSEQRQILKNNFVYTSGYIKKVAIYKILKENIW